MAGWSKQMEFATFIFDLIGTIGTLIPGFIWIKKKNSESEFLSNLVKKYF